MRSTTLGAALTLASLTLGCASSEDWGPSMAKESAPMDEEQGGWGGEAPAPVTAGAPVGDAAPPPGRGLADLGELAFAGPNDRIAGLPGGEQPGQGKPEPKPGAAETPVGPLLIYSADIHLAVHEVSSTQRAIIAVAKEVGGFLAVQDDTKVTIRVPARRFQEALEKCEKAGDVVHRNVQAQDVGEEYRDIAIRLRNAEVVRDRLEELLRQANSVEDALKVQRELGEVTERIETMKGRLRFLQDRISLSTITVWFQPKPVAESLGSASQLSRLPFPWLDELGLQSLLTLREGW
jgi:hypothetical protein